MQEKNSNELKYLQILEDDLKYARDQFFEREKRDPSLQELIRENEKHVYFFYHWPSASFLIFFALLSEYLCDRSL